GFGKRRALILVLEEVQTVHVKAECSRRFGVPRIADLEIQTRRSRAAAIVGSAVHDEADFRRKRSKQRQSHIENFIELSRRGVTNDERSEEHTSELQSRE